MQTFAKKRIEVIAETPIERRLVELLNDLDVSGYTVFPALGGRGRDGVWRREGQVGLADQMFMLVCIVDPARAQTIVESIYELLADRIGIVSVGDVEVIRSELF